MLRSLVVAITLLGGVALAGTFDRAAAQDRRVPTSPADIRLSYAPIVQRVRRRWSTSTPPRWCENRNPLLDDPFFRRFFGGAGGSMPREQMQRSLGSGVIVDAAGLVVTNNHVIEGATR